MHGLLDLKAKMEDGRREAANVFDTLRRCRIRADLMKEVFDKTYHLNFDLVINDVRAVCDACQAEYDTLRKAIEEGKWGRVIARKDHIYDRIEYSVERALVLCLDVKARYAPRPGLEDGEVIQLPKTDLVADLVKHCADNLTPEDVEPITNMIMTSIGQRFQGK